MHTSIVIVTHNQLAYTKLCVESIRRNTAEPYELIFVDNGSTDGTVEWLKGVWNRVIGDRSSVIGEEDEVIGDRSSVIGEEKKVIGDRSSVIGEGPLRVIVAVNAGNRGFPAAANQGIRAASGSRVLLFNNDCIVTDGWLRRMLRAMDAPKPEAQARGVGESPSLALRASVPIGLVGPCSNFVSGRQQVEAGYQGGGQRAEGGEPEASLEQFARDWGAANDGRIEETERLVGFCLLIRREVIERIGRLDERFGIGCFEDDDYCLRARRAGYRCVIARDAFVHHFGGATFIGEAVDHGAAMRQGERRFHEKWGGVSGDRLVASGGQISNQQLPISDPATVVTCSDPGSLIPNPCLLSLCMICRDNERTIRAALESIRPHVDEMVVVDTGSKDRTPEIAAELGARVFHFAWCDDFSAARNESIRHALGAWIFWMDTDDTIDEENGRKLRELVRQVAAPARAGLSFPGSAWERAARRWGGTRLRWRPVSRG